ncbi:MAG TPA: AAC(3) family N-acetyltransferase [Thermomicrobiales bacterium]
MNERDTIAFVTTPATIGTLTRDLAALGVQPGISLLVHSSLSALGWVSGGALAVVLALREAIGSEGTLVMPTHSGDLTDPADWRNPPVPEVWWPIIRETMPAFDPILTPTRGMGAIPDCFRAGHDVLRSGHPQGSFAARGRWAERITAGHELTSDFGDRSPLARLYDLDGWVLLLGVGHGNNTSLHLAEYRATYPMKRFAPSGAPVLVEGERRWVEFQTLQVDSDDFPAIGTAFAQDTGLVRTGQIAAAPALLMPQRALVDYGVRWMELHRPEPAEPTPA